MFLLKRIETTKTPVFFMHYNTTKNSKFKDKSEESNRIFKSKGVRNVMELFGLSAYYAHFC